MMDLNDDELPAVPLLAPQRSREGSPKIARNEYLTCIRCGVTKHADEFRLCVPTGDVGCRACVVCERERHRAWRARNPERVRAREVFKSAGRWPERRPERQHGTMR